MKSITYNGRTALAALAATLLFSLGTAHADNRFGDGVGGAMGGTGSFGAGSVTIHHNLLPEERQEIDTEIETEIEKLRNELKALLAQQNSKFEGQIASIANQSVSVGSLRCGSGVAALYVGQGRTSGNTCDGRTSTACILVFEGGQLKAKTITSHSSGQSCGGGG